MVHTEVLCGYTVAGAPPPKGLKKKEEEKGNIRKHGIFPCIGVILAFLSSLTRKYML